MKKIIPFTKDIKFNTKIYEISSISLENTLSIEENNVVDGEFIVSGDYKMNDSSINTEPFIYGLPFNINLDEKYDTDSLKVDIDDFNFEIINEEVLKVNISVLIEGEEKKEEVKEEVTINEEIQPDYIIEARKEKTDPIDEYIDIKNEVIKEDIMKEEDLFKQTDENTQYVSNVSNDKKVTSIFENFDSKDEKYVSYYVHIVRENDNIDTICTKYKITIDDLKEYNNIDQITLENKIIVPYINNETV